MRRFGELETVIMDRLWESGRPVLVREVVDVCMTTGRWLTPP